MKNSVPSAPAAQHVFPRRMPRLSRYYRAMTMLALTIITSPMILRRTRRWRRDQVCCIGNVS